MARMTVLELQQLHNYQWSYRITERINGQDKVSFYYNKNEYTEFMKEVANATATGVVVEYGARFVERPHAR